jgi:hypothetical protein
VAANGQHPIPGEQPVHHKTPREYVNDKAIPSKPWRIGLVGMRFFLHRKADLVAFERVRLRYEQVKSCLQPT